MYVVGRSDNDVSDEVRGRKQQCKKISLFSAFTVIYV